VFDRTGRAVLGTAFCSLGNAGLRWLILCLTAHYAIRLDLSPRRLLLEVELALFRPLSLFWRLYVPPVDLPQLDESVLRNFQQSFQLFSQAFLLKKQVMVEVELAAVAAGRFWQVLHLFPEDLSIDPSVEAKQALSNLKQFLPQESVLLHGQGQFPLVAFEQEGVLVSFFLLPS
jgi:hypothetical protein